MTNGKRDVSGTGKRCGFSRPGTGVRARRPAFTLIEVLVVVAIIALLISILLPSLKEAREHSYTVKCLANLKGLATATTAYLGDHKNVFPWGTTSESARTGRPYHHFFGGNGGKGDGKPYPAPWWSYAPGSGSTYDIRADRRPMNRYLTSRRMGERSEIEVFECPKDTGVRSRVFFSTAKSDHSAYEVCGTSYQANVTWYEYVRQIEAKTPRVPNVDARAYVLMKRYVPLMERKGPSRVIMLHEDPSDCTLGGVFWDWDKNYRHRGWHGKINRHSVSFLDGHADNLYIEFKKVLDHNYKGAGGGFNDSCNPAVGDDCQHGDANWVARHDFMAE